MPTRSTVDPVLGPDLRLAWFFMALFAVACGSDSKVGDAAGPYRLEIVAEGRGDSVDMGRPLLVRSGENGRIHIASQRLSGLVMTLDSSAELIRTFGQVGQGPGEFEFVSQILPIRGDSMLIGDLRGDLALFDQDGDFVRVDPRRIRTIGQTLLLRGDTIVLAEPFYSESRFGFPLHLIAPQGDTVRSFGSEDRSFDRRRTMALVRHIAPETDSTIWVAYADRYRIERWHIDGSLLQQLELERSWFPAGREPWDGTTSTAYPTVLRDVHQDSDGHLIVILERARSDFSTTGQRGEAEPSSSIALGDRLEFMEQIIEVLDPESGALLGSIRHSGSYLLNAITGDRVVGVGSYPDGMEYPIIYRLVYPAKTLRGGQS